MDDERDVVSAVNRLILLGCLTLGLAGCNLALGIDEAELVEPDAGSGGSGGSSGSGGTSGSPGSGGTSSLGGSGGTGGGEVCAPSGEGCWDCTASSCCGAYASCVADQACTSAIAKYNDCLAAPPTDGSTCAELSAALSGKFLTLSQCVFLGPCATACSNYPLGNLCSPYCDCMDGTCPDYIDDKAACLASCPSLTLAQIRCRPLHCTFAQSDPDAHCPHAAGLHVCP
jgi:hypothetical protein